MSEHEKNPNGVIKDAATDIPRDHVADADVNANVQVPEGYQARGSRAAQGNPAQLEGSPDPDTVPLGGASGGVAAEPIYSDTATSKDDPVYDDAIVQAEQETDAQRAAAGIDPEKAREHDGTASRKEALEDSRATPDDESGDVSREGSDQDEQHKSE